MRETHRLIIKHIAQLRQIDNLAEATIVFCLESNLAYEAQHILHAIQSAGIRKWVALQEGAGGTLGWLTTNERKESMCFQLRDALRVGSIRLGSGFFSVTHSVTEAKRTLESELKNYAILVEAAKTPFGKVKKTYSGKCGGRNDDVAIALQLSVAGIRMFFQSDKYRTFR